MRYGFFVLVCTAIMKPMKSVLLFCLGFLFSVSLSAQGPARIEGDVLVVVKENSKIEDIASRVNQEMGLLVDLKINKLVSAPMRTYLLNFNEQEVSLRELLYVLRKTEGVSMAQGNHIVENRDTTPNDPFYNLQWHHNNSGDNDIDTPAAWDITTGGITATGDDIVVCVVETNGTNWAQADIVDNHWVNIHEIPNNGVDDDDNGFIDDYDGWNNVQDNDNVGTGNHGTQVSSMIGAKGNNGTGIAGVNWDVKIMQVHMGGISEANVVASYTYPWIMRKLYNETNGAKGAFVVVTNSSWGIDQGQPDESPIWCAMYDSLGMAGVLSCGATSNSEYDVDALGDLPTACPSDYLVSVTATDDNDVRTFSAFGATTIDLGAPGDNVYLAGNNNYGNTSGTSFASPCVAGAIALVYSAPCVSFMSIAYADPAMAAQMMKGYIMDGTDAAPALAGECITGGRLNVKNSIDLILAACSNDDCIAPFSILANQTPGQLDYTLSWAAIPSQESFTVQFRPQGGSWTTVENVVTNSLTLNDLLSCSTYEVQINALCNGETSEWSSVYTFETDGCCENPSQLTISNINETGATLSWNAILAAEGYTLILIDAQGNQVIVTETTGTSGNFTGLEPCSAYTATVTSICASNGLPVISTIDFNTFGCGACDDLDYCETIASTEYEYIENISLGTMNNTSGNNDGYAFFQDQSIILELGETYTLSATPGYVGDAYNQNFRGWIDFNSNGIFETSELIFSPQTTETTVSEDFTVPGNAALGTTRMRIAMSYAGWFQTAIPDACGDNDTGESEDYCVTIINPINVAEKEATRFSVFPNPATEYIQWSNKETYTNIAIFNLSGQMIRQISNPTENRLSIEGIADGLYILRATNNAGSVFSKELVILPK